MKAARNNGSFPVKGFTLAELLISLLIIGEIATFTIPKIISAQQNNQKIAIFKETIGAIAAVVDEGFKTGQLDPTTNGDTYFLTNLNSVKVCNSNSSTQGCWNTAIQGTPTAEYNEPGVIMHNGAYVVGFVSTTSPAQG